MVNARIFENSRACNLMRITCLCLAVCSQFKSVSGYDEANHEQKNRNLVSTDSPTGMSKGKGASPSPTKSGKSPKTPSPSISKGQGQTTPAPSISKGKGGSPAPKAGSGKKSTAPYSKGKGVVTPAPFSKGKGGSGKKSLAPVPSKGATAQPSKHAPPPSKGSGKGTSMSKSSKKSSKSKMSKKAPTKKPKPTPSPGPPAPTTSPTVSPTSAAPSPSAPVSEVPTSVPSDGNFPTRVLSTYELLYTIVQSRFPLPSEYDEVANITDIYLQNYWNETFSTNPTVNFRSSETVLIDFDFSFGDPVVIIYDTVLTFTQDSVVPSVSELDEALEDAFVGVNEPVYRNFLVSNLDDTNIFETTSDVGFQFTSTAAVAASEQQEESSESVFLEGSSMYIVAGAAAGLGAFLLVLFGLNVYDRRKQEAQRCDLMDKETIGDQTEDETTASAWTSHASIMTSKVHHRSSVSGESIDEPMYSRQYKQEQEEHSDGEDSAEIFEDETAARLSMDPIQEKPSIGTRGILS